MSGSAEETGAALGPGHEPDVRFSLANERTLLAYQRTTIGLVAAGVGVVKLLDDEVLTYVLGALFIVCAAIAGVGGHRRYVEADHAIREGRSLGPGRTSVALSVGLLLCVVVGALYVVTSAG
ncbi:YidH family protein [Marmoricola sp. RAF53]|uniref:YidH family protein n=1 Tax=Marmoricola sp. RAF53 TaxID=3233059 RepID=UPI003F9AA57C